MQEQVNSDCDRVRSDDDESFRTVSDFEMTVSSNPFYLNDVLLWRIQDRMEDRSTFYSRIIEINNLEIADARMVSSKKINVNCGVLDQNKVIFSKAIVDKFALDVNCKIGVAFRFGLVLSPVQLTGYSSRSSYSALFDSPMCVINKTYSQECQVHYVESCSNVYGDSSYSVHGVFNCDGNGNVGMIYAYIIIIAVQPIKQNEVSIELSKYVKYFKRRKNAIDW